jgi:hypothetical protein
MTAPDTTRAEEYDRALHLVASRQLAAASSLQRWMGIGFLRATELLDELHRKGWVGPADGSKSRTVHARRCEQCGRIGRRGFRHLRDDEHGVSITVCSNNAACRKRWPKPQYADA